MPYSLRLLFLALLLATKAPAQGWARLPDEITFANHPIHLTAQTRSLIQQALEQAYASPYQSQQELEALRRLMPLWKPFFKKAALPDDYGLLALPFSDADTLGYWALPAAQAQQLNLHSDKWVDERYHPLNATEAVVAKLQQWQQQQPNAVVVLLRYLEWSTSTPHPQRVDRHFIQPDAQSPPLLWRLLARKVALTSPPLRFRPTTDSISYVYSLGHEQSLQEVAQRLPVTLEQLRANNRWLKSEWLPTDKDYSVIVPLTPDGFAQAARFVESANPPPASTVLGFPVLSKTAAPPDPLRASAQYYRINQRLGVQAQNCDNLVTLAFYGHMPVRRFLRYNDLTDEKAVVHPGQIYYLRAKARRAPVPFHVLESNQTLLEVANLYGIRLQSLLTFNRLAVAHRLPAGRLLWLQRKRPAKQPVAYVQAPQPPARPIRMDSLATPPATPTDPRPASRDSVLYSFGGRLLVDTATQAQPIAMEDTSSAPPPVAEVDRPAARRHRVQAGQTYYSIARLYHISLPQLYRWNQLTATIPLQVGQSLRVQEDTDSAPSINPVTKYAVGSRTGASPVKTRSPVLRKALFCTVQTGQTLYRIALQYRVRVKDLVSWNNLKSVGLEAGQILLIWR